MEFIETINIKKDDMRNLNLYLASLNKNLGMVLAGGVIFALGIYGLITGGEANLVLNILTVILGLIGIIHPLCFNKLIIKAKIKKIEFEDLEPVEVTVNDEGILYQFVSEKETKDLKPCLWSQILRVVETNDYLYVHLADRRSVMIIILRDIVNPQFTQFIKDKMVKAKRYITKTK